MRVATLNGVHGNVHAVDGVNAGSVGRPWEDDGGAYSALLGSDVELRCTRYDVEAAVREMRLAGFPNDEFFASLLVARGADETTRRLEEAP